MALFGKGDGQLLHHDTAIRTNGFSSRHFPADGIQRLAVDEARELSSYGLM